MDYPARAQSQKGSSAKRACAVNDRQSPTAGPGKDFQEKYGLLHSNSSKPKTKRNIVMDPTGKMVATHRATNAGLTKILKTYLGNQIASLNLLLPTGQPFTETNSQLA